MGSQIVEHLSMNAAHFLLARVASREVAVQEYMLPLICHGSAV